MLKIKVSPWNLRNLAEKQPENYETLRAVVAELPEREKMKDSYFSLERFVNNVEELPDWLIKEAEWEVCRPLQLLSETGISSMPLSEAFMRSQVHLPGNELMRIRQVEVRVDHCTESLQNDLDNGWQIVAICPQAGQRRPDYVLGKVGRD